MGYKMSYAEVVSKGYIELVPFKHHYTKRDLTRLYIKTLLEDKNLSLFDCAFILRCACHYYTNEECRGYSHCSGYIVTFNEEEERKMLGEFARSTTKRYNKNVESV